MKLANIRVAVFGVVVIAVAGLWLLALRNTPARAFDDMLANNLSTPSVTRVVKQGTATLSIAQYTQLKLGQQPSAHALTVFSQNGGLIATEEISDRANDFVRYQKIVATAKSKDGKPINTGSVVGKWAKLSSDGSLGTTVTSGLFNQTLFGVLPIANFQPEQRSELLKYIHDNKVFSYDASKVKTVTVQGRKAYSYAVAIKPAPYIKAMQQFGQLLGADQYTGIDPNNYTNAADISVTIAVDARSHQLAEVNQTASGRVEQYQAFGVVQDTSLPKATLTTKQLTEQLGKLQ